MRYMVIRTLNIINCTILPITSLLQMKKNKTGGTTIFIQKYILYMKMVSTLYEKIPSFYKGFGKIYKIEDILKIPINKKNIEFLCPK